MQWIGPHRDILLIAFVAFVLRLSVIAPLHAQGYTSDEKEYIALAVKVAHGGPFIDSNGDRSTKAPLWPLLLAGMFKLFGEGVFVPHLLNALAGVLAVLLGFLLAIEATGDRRVALAGATMMALYPGLIIYAAILQTETLYIVLLLLAFLWWERAHKQASLRNGLMLGLFAGLATLTRAVFFGFFPVMLVMLWLKGKHRLRDSAVTLGAATLVWWAVLAPWTFRNYTLHGTFVPVSSWGGISLLLGNNPYSTGTWSSKPGFEEWVKKEAEHRGIRLAETNEIERSALGRDLALAYVADHPMDALNLTIKKLYMYAVYPIAHSDTAVAVQAVCVAGDMGLYVLAGLGVLALGKARHKVSGWFVAILFFSAVHMLMHVEARYRLPVVPFIALLAGAGGALLMDTQARREFLHIPRHRRWVGSWMTAVVVVYGYTAWQFFSGKL